MDDLDHLDKWPDEPGMTEEEWDALLHLMEEKAKYAAVCMTVILMALVGMIYFLVRE